MKHYTIKQGTTLIGIYESLGKVIHALEYTMSIKNTDIIHLINNGILEINGHSVQVAESGWYVFITDVLDSLKVGLYASDKKSLISMLDLLKYQYKEVLIFDIEDIDKTTTYIASGDDNTSWNHTICYVP